MTALHKDALQGDFPSARPCPLWGSGRVGSWFHYVLGCVTGAGAEKDREREQRIWAMPYVGTLEIRVHCSLNATTKRRFLEFLRNFKENL